jgi:hypothetical protein
MAYNLSLAERIRSVLENRAGLSERQAFGGLSFLIHGNMAVGVIGDELVVRLGSEAAEAALADPHVRPFDFSGRPMKGWIFVAPTGLESDADLAGWVNQGTAFASGLSPK